MFGAAGRRLLEAVREEPTLAWAVRRGGSIPIGRVAADVGWSHKHLIAMFVERIGLAPKTVARLARFERVLTQVRRGHAPNWGQVAADTGYADQPHLIREFRAFAGTTPTGYVHGTGA